MKILPSLLCLVLQCLAASALAADRMTLCLNWSPGADHAPLYFARSEGWFADAGLAATLVPGGGSVDALSRLGRGECDAAVADFGAVQVSPTHDNAPVAVMAIVSESPLAFLSGRTAPLRGLEDLRGARIAADPNELARRLWPYLLALNGKEDLTVTWVDAPNNSKVDALLTGRADVAASTFYHHVLEFESAFGDRLRSLAWRDLGVNPYGNVLVFARRTIAASPRQVARTVEIVQRAYAACVRAASPCLDALLAANSHLDGAVESSKWRLVSPLIAPPRRRGETLGTFEENRIRATAKRAEVPAGPRWTNEFLSTAHVIP